jgi:hypothetical protein
MAGDGQGRACQMAQTFPDVRHADIDAMRLNE